MTTPAPSTATAQETLQSGLIHLFTGLSFICIAVGFCYLDRSFGHFFAESMFWVLWGVIGFSAGAYTLGRQPEAGKTFSIVLGVIAVVLAVFPGFFIYATLRWVSVLLLLVIAARAPMMHTRRDLYLCLAVCFAVSFMVATHSRADWTLWLYLGPAWVFAGLALTWEYASSRAISHGSKLVMSLAFIALCSVMAMALFIFLPRPPVLGFGFIPPAAATKGLLGQPAGSPSATGKNEGPSAGGNKGSIPGTDVAGSNNADTGWTGKWQGMLEQMRPGSQDPAMPQWQRTLLGKLLDWAHALSGGQNEAALKADQNQSQSLRARLQTLLAWSWLEALLALVGTVLAWLAYRHRYHMGLELMHLGARLLATRRPWLSMRMSAKAMTWCLASTGHVWQPGQSLQEYFASAPAMPRLSRRWFADALALYGATRFGQTPATPARAKIMQQSVSAATELVKGHAPELAQR